MGSLLEELKKATAEEERELEEKSFNYWFDSNEKIKNSIGEKTTDEEKELLRLGYHFGFYNAMNIVKGR